MKKKRLGENRHSGIEAGRSGRCSAVENASTTPGQGADDQSRRGHRRQSELAEGGVARALRCSRTSSCVRRSRISITSAFPERIVHARGSGAHGFFECYDAFTSHTKAAPFAKKGKITPVFVRFSTVAGERGSADTARDVRGFAVKFYTDEGNWDLVGNNIPVFFVQDAIKFPDLIHAAKPEPHNQIPQAATAHDTFWDFVSLMPESTHMLMWIMSDRAIPQQLPDDAGFSASTRSGWSMSPGVSVFCKFHWKPAARNAFLGMGRSG